MRREDGAQSLRENLDPAGLRDEAMEKVMPEDVRLAVVLTGNAGRRVAGLSVLARIQHAFSSVGMEPTAFVVTDADQRAVASVLGIPNDRIVENLSQLEAGTWIVCRSDMVLDRVMADHVLSLARNLGQDRHLRLGRSICIGFPVEDCSGAEPIEPKGVFVELDGPGAAFRAKRALIRACRKPVAIDGLVCRALGRPLSGWITHVLLELPVTPNMVTAVSLVLGLAAAVTVAFEQRFALGAGLLFLSWVLDNSDGEIARTKYLGSTWGAWFDIYADFLTNEAFIVGMGYGLSKALESPLLWWVGLYAAVVLALYNAVVFAHIHRLGIPDEFLFQWWFDASDEQADSESNSGGKSVDGGGGSSLARFFSYVKYLGRRDFFIFFYFVSALLGILHWALWATALGATFTGILTVGHVIFSRHRHV